MIRTTKNGSEIRIPSLVYTSDEEPGISRIRRGRGFQYLLPDRSPLKDRVELARIRSTVTLHLILALPSHPVAPAQAGA